MKPWRYRVFAVLALAALAMPGQLSAQEPAKKDDAPKAAAPAPAVTQAPAPAPADTQAAPPVATDAPAPAPAAAPRNPSSLRSHSSGSRSSATRPTGWASRSPSGWSC